LQRLKSNVFQRKKWISSNQVSTKLDFILEKNVY